MKTAKQWMDNLDRFESPLWNGYDMSAFIRAIQSDARLAALEEAARVCEEIGHKASMKLYARYASTCSDAIRALASAPGSGQREGTP